MISNQAVEAAAKARRQLKLDRYYSTREVVSMTYEGHRIYRSAPEPAEEEYALAALEAAAPFIQAQALRDAVDAFPLETITAPDNAVAWLRRRAEQIAG